MALFLYILFIAMSSSMFIWGLLKKDRFLQYPTIAGATWLVFFGVQAFGAVRNPGKYPQGALDDGGLIIALVMLCLCSAAGWLGYHHGGRSRRFLRFTELSDQRIFWVGVVLYSVGFFAAYRLAQLTGGFIQQFTGGGHYGLEWRGEPVKYSFFIQLIYPGLALVLMSALRRSSYSKLLVSIVMMLYPMAVIVFLGRRSKVAMLGGIILIALFFTRRLRIPRLATILGLIAVVLVVYYAPAYRSVSQHGLDYAAIRESISKSQAVSEAMGGETYSEFDVGVVWGAAVSRNLAFGLGLDFYNALVSMYIPRQIVGEEFKSALFYGPSLNVREMAKQGYGWEPKYGSFVGGPYTAFSQFWFFGCLLYYVFGYVFRLLWEAAYGKNSLSAQIWYINCFFFIPLSITMSIVAIPAQFIYIVVLMWFVTRFCRGRSPYPSGLSPEPFGFSVEGLPLI